MTETMKTVDAFELILGATKPDDIFGTASNLRGMYRKLVAEVHPDVSDDSRAVEATTKLNLYFDAAKKSIQAGVYGTAAAPPVDAIRVQTKRHAYSILGTGAIKGDTCNIWPAQDEDRQDVLLKVVRNAKDNDLVANEARIVKLLLSNKKTYDELALYLPSYIETFGYRVGGKGQAKQTNAFHKVDGLYTLEQVSQRFPRGLPPKHVAWIFRRLLYALGLVHENNVIHGAVLPCHVLIHPEQHGLVLLDWKYATQGEPIKAISSKYKQLYPQEVLAKEPPGRATDIFMAVRCMEYLCYGNTLGIHPGVPRQLSAFFNGSRQANIKRRPQDAFELRDEFKELIERMWGPRTFLPLELT